MARPVPTPSTPYQELISKIGSVVFETAHPAAWVDGTCEKRDLMVHESAPVYASFEARDAPLATLKAGACVGVVERKTTGDGQVWYRLLAKKEMLVSGNAPMDWLDTSEHGRPTSSRYRMSFAASAASPTRYTHVWAREVVDGKVRRVADQ